jgi:hypothetical protein
MFPLPIFFLADDCIIFSPFFCEGFVLLHVNSFFVYVFQGKQDEVCIFSCMIFPMHLCMHYLCRFHAFDRQN